MAREYELKPAPSDAAEALETGATTINRRQFMRYGFNTAAGVLTASLGMLGFAAILLPPGGGSGGDLAVQFWAKGREDEAWYGAKHLQPMTKSDFAAEAASSSTGTAGAAGVWNGVPVVVNYVSTPSTLERRNPTVRPASNSWKATMKPASMLVTSKISPCLLYTSPSPRD